MSNINYLSINENFPVAGQDNDTQVFRDNFDTIKNSLRAAQEEITLLELNSAPLNEPANFRGNEISQAKLRNVTDANLDTQAGRSGEVSNLEIYFTNGGYQSIALIGDVTVEFKEFPGDSEPSEAPTGTGRITLELKSSTSDLRTVTFTTSAGAVFRKNGFTEIGVSTSTSFNIQVDSNPIVIEVWRYKLEHIYMKSLGVFS